MKQLDMRIDGCTISKEVKNLKIMKKDERKSNSKVRY